MSDPQTTATSGASVGIKGAMKGLKRLISFTKRKGHSISGNVPSKTSSELQIPPFIVIGLIIPIGIDSDSVMAGVSSSLAKFSYLKEEIKISDFISATIKSRKDDLSTLSFYDRKIALMKQGDILRKSTKELSICASFAVSRIMKARNKDSSKRLALIINSIKNEAEITLLRKVYGRRFIAISFISKYDRRETYLKQKIKAQQTELSIDQVQIQATDLINRDKRDANAKSGQQIAACVPEADVFINDIDEKEITRAFKAWLGDPFITPSIEEQSMYFAYSSGLKSADMSRQVGAAITNDLGDIITTGCNDVPKPEGGYYWDGDEHDKRDLDREYDENQAQKEQLLKEFVGIFPDTILSFENKAKLCKEILFGSLKPLYKKTRMGNLIEFGRMVHAEMASINSAARQGRSLAKTTLYCTTFPCHMCAKLIISSGIKEVVFIEPYEKSMTGELFRGQIKIVNEEPSSREDHQNAIPFRSFIGIAPKRYVEFFSFKDNRKDANGKRKKWDAHSAVPSHEMMVELIKEQETVALTALESVVIMD